MKLYLKKNGIRVLVILIISVAMVFAASRMRAGIAGPITNAAAAVALPVKRAAAGVSEWFEKIYGALFEYEKVVAENEVLRQELAEAKELAREAADAVEENQRLREVLNLRDKHSDFELESAKIIGWNTTNWAATFTISKGSDHGVKLNDCVITEYGALVGQVIELGGTWATVRVITDIETKVGALVGEAGNAAMAVGDFSLMQINRLKLSYLTEGAQPLTGDTILSSGKGGVVPQGLIIGRIESVESEAGGQTLYGIIEPGCDLDRLVQVFIIKSFDVTE